MGAHRSWRQTIRKLLVIIGIIVAFVLGIAVIVGIIGGYHFSWDWTGVKTKTLWDWLQLLGVLAIPIVVGFGTAVFATRQTQISEANRKQQHDTEMQIAENQQQEELLRTYFDKISELILNPELSTNRNVASLVRARTLAALHLLNATRKGIVLQFLHDLELLQHVKRYFFLLDLSNIQLIRIDLHEADLFQADLHEADLRETKLHKADLRGADIRAGDLRGTFFMSANLHKADMAGADLRKADFSAADLSGANLTNANLSEADLSGADLSGANLKEITGITVEELENLVSSRKGAIMPDGSIHS